MTHDLTLRLALARAIAAQPARVECYAAGMIQLTDGSIWNEIGNGRCELIVPPTAHNTADLRQRQRAA